MLSPHLTKDQKSEGKELPSGDGIPGTGHSAGESPEAGVFPAGSGASRGEKRGAQSKGAPSVVGYLGNGVQRSQALAGTG